MDAIDVDHVSKRYRLGLEHGDLRELIAGSVARATGRRPPAATRDFWALRDVSLTVPHGQAVGLIGRNGAGKSTLLKVLTRITEPTTGRSRTRGRVGALLEVGTGFHGELTGRENVFLNGAILGMPRRSIASRLDDIVEFAGVERFIDTPVKRYSSGMFLRLAFSVAAHLDTEILVVDEVLAVGDAEFQQRCLGRMSQVESEGRTVVFVSHDHHAVANLCDRVIWLDQGAVVADGPTRQVIDRYLAAVRTVGGPAGGVWAEDGSPCRVLSFEAETTSTADLSQDCRAPLRFRFTFELTNAVEPFYACIQVHDPRGHILIEERVPVDPCAAAGSYCGTMELPPLLNVGRFAASFWAGTRYEQLAYAERAVAFDVVGDAEDRIQPTIRTQPTWRVDGPIPSSTR